MTERSEDRTWEEHTALAAERWKAHDRAHQAEIELNAQRWSSHQDQHKYIANNLAEYKSQSNEWRASITDLRLTFVSRNEVDALNTKIDAFREELRTLISTEREERRERTGQRQGVTATTGTIVSTAVFIATILGIIIILANFATRGP